MEKQTKNNLKYFGLGGIAGAFALWFLGKIGILGTIASIFVA